MERIDSPYYFGNKEMKPVVLQAKNSYSCITQELPWDLNSEDFIRAVYTLGVGLGFSAESILCEMKTFAEDNLLSEEVIE